MNPDPMSALLNGLPPAPSNPAAPTPTPQDTPVFAPSSAPFFGPEPTAAPAPYPTLPPAPVPSPYQQPAAPMAPPAPMPSAPPPVQPYPQPQQPIPQSQPTAPPQGYPVAGVPIPPQPGDAPLPDWAQEVLDAAEQLKAAQQQPTDGDGWPERGRNWADFRKAVRAEAQSIVEAHETEKKRQDAAVAAQASMVNKQFDAVEAQLQQLNLLPPITNPNDSNDPGRLARRELYAYTNAQGGTGPEHVGPAAMTLKALHDSGMYFDANSNMLVRRGSQSAAANAPIAGASPVMGAQGGTSAAPTQTMLGMPLDQLASIGMGMLPQ